MLVYARLETPHVRAFEERANGDGELTRLLGNFAVARVDLDGPDDAANGVPGLTTGPRFLVVEPTPEGDFLAVDAAEPWTGALFEPHGLRAELARIEAGLAPLADLLEALQDADPPAAPEALAVVRRLEAMGWYGRAESVFAEALAMERHPNGPLHRHALLREALMKHRPLDVLDGEGAIEEHLTVEADKGVLFQGWSTLASGFAARVQTFDEPGTPDSVRAVGMDRWRRRMRNATRLGYKHCPDERLVPYMALLLERYAEDPEDLDSMDRSFCRAVQGRLKRDAPGSEWARRAETLFGR